MKWKALVLCCLSLLFGAALYSFSQLSPGRPAPKWQSRETLPLLDESPHLSEKEREKVFWGEKTGLWKDVSYEFLQFLDDPDQSPRLPDEDGNHYQYYKGYDDPEQRNDGPSDPQSRLSSPNTTVYHQLSEFKILPSFHFPQPQFSRPDNAILQSDWVMELKRLLSTVRGNQVSLVTASIEHRDIIINWLISAYLVAAPPLDNVLCLSLNEPLHWLLQRKGFASLYVNPDDVINPMSMITRTFSRVHIVRLTVLRIITHFGFDVVNYDCDAILLKNPQVLFDRHKDVDVIGTFGKGPWHYYDKWGVTLNTGVLLFRSNSRVELFWEEMSKLRNPTTDDQGNVNRAFDTMGMQWTNFRRKQNMDTFEEEIYGVCGGQTHLLVMLLPFNIICRQTCTAERRDEYYVWHSVAIKENRTVENKVKGALAGGAWFLKENWYELSKQRTDPLTGVEWLKYVTDPSVFRVHK